MLDAIRERIKQRFSFFGPERTMRRFARNWMDKANALSLGELGKAGFDELIKEIEGCKARGEKDELLKAYSKLEKGFETLLNKELGAEKAEIFMVDQYLKYFNDEVYKIRNDIKKILDDKTRDMIEHTISEIYEFFKKSIEYMIKFEKNLAFERTQSMTIRFAADTIELREMGFTHLWQKELDRDEHNTFKEIHKTIEMIKAGRKDVEKNKAHLVELFKKLKDDYAKEKIMEERYIYDLVTRIEKAAKVIIKFEEKEIAELTKMKLDEPSLKTIRDTMNALFPKVKEEAAREWQLAKDVLKKIKG